MLTVRAFGAELMKIGSGGSLEISSGGFRTWRTFQALNMVLAPVGLELEAHRRQHHVERLERPPRPEAARRDFEATAAADFHELRAERPHRQHLRGNQTW